MFLTICFAICFTLCLFITGSPDLDGYRAPKMKYCPRRDPQKVSKPEYEATALCLHQSINIGYPNPMFVTGHKNETCGSSVPLTGCISGGKGHLDQEGIRWKFGEIRQESRRATRTAPGSQASGQQTGVMADDANHASGAGAGSRGCPIGRDVGDGAAAGSSSNPRRSKRQREQKEDQGMAGEDLDIYMACVL